MMESAIQQSSRSSKEGGTVKRLSAFALMGVVTLSGCVTVPADPYYGYDYPPAGYYSPGPYYYGPSISLGIFSSRSYGSGGYHGRRPHGGRFYGRGYHR